MKKLKERWGISSNLQVLIIFTVFGLTGSSSVYVAKPILEMIGFSRLSFAPEFFWGGLSYYFLRLIMIFPIYQVLLIAYGWIFGQFSFFWQFEKKMFSRMGLVRLEK